MVDEAGDSIVADATEEKKKGLPLIPILLVVVVLGGLGAVGWFVVLPMLSGETAEPAGESETTEQTPALGPNVYDPENKPGILEFQEPFLIKLKKIEGVLQHEMYLKLSISLEVGSPEIQDEMMEDTVVMARISDIIITFFAEKTSNEVDSVRWPELKERLIEAVNSQVGPDYQVKRVNFHSFLIQPGR
jgi:flagellar basal body-associated protein FliL